MNSEGKAPVSTSQPKRPRCQPTPRPIEAGGSGADRTIETHDQKHGAQRYVPIPNDPFLSVFRGKALGITLQLSMDTLIDLPGDQRHFNISQSMSISRSRFQDMYRKTPRTTPIKDINSSNDQKFARFGLVIQYTEAH